MRLQGWMGRADQTTKVKGLFVHPAQIAKIVARHPEILRARLVVENDGIQDLMTLNCEVQDAHTKANREPALNKEILANIQTVCKMRGNVAFTEPGSLPDDGKVIDDIRDQAV